MFLWNFSEIVRKIWRNVGNFSYKFFNTLIEILWVFLSIFGRTYETLWEKYDKYFTVFVSFRGSSYHSVHYDGAKKYFSTSNQVMFQFL